MGEKNRKSKQFVDTPQYPGGRKALEAFVNSLLQYPADAIEQRIEGTVRVAYQVNDDGLVTQANIVKGLCPSCNTEALRIVYLLRYAPARNRGVRLKANCHLDVHFHLAPTPPQPTLRITYSQSPAQSPQRGGAGFSYKITIKSE